jgi:hypothetical protein
MAADGTRWARKMRGEGAQRTERCNKKGRREAGLFADVSAQAEIDLSTSR